MTASSSSVSASASAVSDSCHEFRSYGCSPPSQSGSGRQTSTVMSVPFVCMRKYYPLGTMTSLLCRIRSSRIVNGAVSTSTSLQYTQLCVGRSAALKSQLRAWAINFRRLACAAKPWRLSTSWLTFCPKSFSSIEISPYGCFGSGSFCRSVSIWERSERVRSFESDTKKAKSMR